MFIADNIRYLRKRSGYSQEDLSEMLGYKSFTTIQKWESGVSEPPLGVFVRLAEIFGVDLDDFARKDLSREDMILFSNEDPGIAPDLETAVQNNDFFSFTVTDASMSPKYSPGDVVVFKRQDFCENGDECIVSIEGAAPEFRKVRLSEYSVMLQPINPEYEPEQIGKEKSSSIMILGVAKEIRRAL